MTTSSEARDYLYQLCVKSWGTRGPIEWEDTPQKPGEENLIPPKASIPWMRLRMVHENGRLATLCDKDGLQRFRKTGTFWAQTFAPLGTSLIEPEKGANLIETALQKPKKVQGLTVHHCVELRNVRQNEAGSDGHWYLINVKADFEYDEVK